MRLRQKQYERWKEQSKKAIGVMLKKNNHIHIVLATFIWQSADAVMSWLVLAGGIAHHTFSALSFPVRTYTTSYTHEVSASISPFYGVKNVGNLNITLCFLFLFIENSMAHMQRMNNLNGEQHGWWYDCARGYYWQHNTRLYWNTRSCTHYHEWALFIVSSPLVVFT